MPIRNTASLFLYLLFLGYCDTRLTEDYLAANDDNIATKNSKIEKLELKLLGGKAVVPFDNNATKAVVLVFISTDCPIANAYHPTLKKLESKFAPKGVKFFLVHSSSDITERDAKSHLAEYNLNLPIVIDKDQKLARRIGARVTPEAIVIDAGSNKPVYRGAIDNLYAGYGKKRKKVTQNYLKDALTQLLAGRPIIVAESKPVGCFISFDRN